ncbi:hypothetical protein PMAYCL1PPCAC_15540, partial [Pristionchus mayeri]
MFLVCHPLARLTKTFTSMSTVAILVFHGLPPLMYAIYVLLFQQYRQYEYDVNAGTITRIGDEWSIDFNSNVMIGTSTSCALISAVCYIRIFSNLRNRPVRSSGRELSVITTSFALFVTLCAVCAYFIVNKYSLIAQNWEVFYTTRNLNYVVSFSIALINPWCLLVTNAQLRSAMIGHRLRNLCMTLPLCHRFTDYSTTDNPAPAATALPRHTMTRSTTNTVNP